MPGTAALTSTTTTGSLLDGASNQNQQIPTSEVMLTQLCALMSNQMRFQQDQARQQ